ncbi:hypothetical protein OSB04_032225 [Centaurea solstitialis]|uniref:Transposase n=1 Tax=Centaurea solstitialis TaxID=347529 RepID=A0AA38VYC3_9ASTR|nr:hypothetical protein OSB04_032225 [Centaurea solstitialis]
MVVYIKRGPHSQEVKNPNFGSFAFFLCWLHAETTLHAAHPPRRQLHALHTAGRIPPLAAPHRRPHHTVPSSFVSSITTQPPRRCYHHHCRLSPVATTTAGVTTAPPPRCYHHHCGCLQSPPPLPTVTGRHHHCRRHHSANTTLLPPPLAHHHFCMYFFLWGLSIFWFALYNLVSIFVLLYNMSTNREWMYKKNDNQGCLSRGFVNALEGFLDFAYANEGTVERKTMRHGIVLRIRCPCSKCQNTHHRERDDMKSHLMKYGFMLGYTMWWAHGETYHHTYHQDVGQSSNPIVDHNEGYVEMVNDQMVHDGMTWEEQTPNPYAQGFYDMLQAADEPLWDGGPNFSKLGAATRMLHWKAEHNVPVATYDPNYGMIKEMLPEGNKLPANFYETKKCLKKLALPKVKIDACKNHCMLFYKLHSNLTHCLYCKESRYKTSGQRKVSNLVLTYLPIVPRLQRLYMSKKTSKEMTWHKDHQTEPGVMVHPSDGEAWKRFDTQDPDFASEIRNLKNGGKPCWFDCHRRWLPETHPFRRDRTGFRVGARVSLGPPPILTGEEIWEQVRHLPTVYEGEPFRSSKRKISGFGTHHNWVKRSIFWELPYWKTLLIRHNLDVMHIEKNVFENLFNTLMDTPKTKDNIKARRDLQVYCNRRELHVSTTGNRVVKPQSSYSLTKKQVKLVCSWLKTLKFPDGYASNIGGCVNLEDSSFYSFKSHDCHVFMQRLLPIALRGMIPTPTWDAITELCTFFRAICSRVLHIEDLVPLRTSVIQTICKLEKIFPPGFFDSMEHLVIHLAEEAIIGGPVQYRWMYLYERKLGSLKRTIRNKARVEGSIVESYLVNELSTYCSLYFDPQIETRHNRESSNFAPDIPSYSGTGDQLSIFKVPSRPLFEKRGKQIILNDHEMHKIHTYILFNCEEVHPFHTVFDECVRRTSPNIDDVALEKLREETFSSWFEHHVQMSPDSSEQLKSLARKPGRFALSHPGYFVNGYKFHTVTHGAGRVTHNSGVCVRGSSYGESDESDYYGMLDDVLEVEYYGVGRSIVALFKCIWFDTPSGVRVDRKHSLVDVKYKSRLRADDSYILASQAEQVYYTSYPSMTNDLKDWWAVVKTKPRGIYEVSKTVNDVEVGENMEGEQFYQMNERVTHTPSVGLNNDLDFVNLVTGEVILVDAPNDDDHDDANEDSEEEAEFEEWMMIQMTKMNLFCLIILLMSSLSFTMPPRSNRGKGTGQMGRGGGRDGGRAGGSSSSAGRGNERADDYDEFRGVTPPSVGHDIDIDIAIDEDEMTGEVQPSSASVLRTRGPNRSIGVPRNPSLRETLVISASGRFENIKAKAAMFTIFKANFRGPWTSWDKVPQGERDCMFKMFQALELDGIEWDREDMSVIRGHHPIWIPAEYWHEMIDKVWSKPAWLAWSKSGTCNRNTEGEGVSSRHTGGSIPTDEHRKRMLTGVVNPLPLRFMSELTTRTVSMPQVRPVPLTMIPSTFTLRRVEQLRAFERLEMWRSRPRLLTTHRLTRSLCVSRVLGDEKNGRLFGFGTSCDPSYAITGRCSSSGATGESSSEIAELREQLKTMEQRHQEAEERHQKAEEHHQAMYDWLRSSGFRPPSPTPTPTPSAPSPPLGPPPL